MRLIRNNGVHIMLRLMLPIFCRTWFCFMLHFKLRVWWCVKDDGKGVGRKRGLERENEIKECTIRAPDIKEAYDIMYCS